MKLSRQTTALVSSLALLSVAAFAQQTPASNPSSNPASTPERMPADPQVTAPSAAATNPNARTDTTARAGTNAQGTMNAQANSNANAGLFAGPDAGQLAKIDTDHDGRISRAEFLASDAKMTPLDTNNDGVVSADEQAAAAKGQKKHWWSRKDSSGAEMDQADVFAKLDTNKDGYLSAEELAQVRATPNK
jgi:hypothetical protein